MGQLHWLAGESYSLERYMLMVIHLEVWGVCGDSYPEELSAGWVFRDLRRLFSSPSTPLVNCLRLLTCSMFGPHSSMSTRRILRTSLASLTGACCWIRLAITCHWLASWTLWYLLGCGASSLLAGPYCPGPQSALSPGSISQELDST